MLSIVYSPEFVRKYKKFNSARKYEVKERIAEFQDVSNHKRLKVHKLKGVFKDSYAFSVNYSDRIIFRWSKDKKTAYIVNIGDHGMYSH